MHTTLSCLPVGHVLEQAVQLVDPAIGVDLPSAQRMHVADELPPVTLLYVPAWQSVHTVAPAMVVKVPWGHAMDVPFGEQVPGLLRRHWGPVGALYVVGGQEALQEDALM